jgi:hypothetical protein
VVFSLGGFFEEHANSAIGAEIRSARREIIARTVARSRARIIVERVMVCHARTSLSDFRGPRGLNISKCGARTNPALRANASGR